MKPSLYHALFLSIYFILSALLIVTCLRPTPAHQSQGRARLQVPQVVPATQTPLPKFTPEHDYDPIFVSKVQNFTLCESAIVRGSPRDDVLPRYIMPVGTAIKSHDWYNGYVMFEPAYWLPVSALCRQD